MTSYLDFSDRKRLQRIEQSQGIKIIQADTTKYGYIFYGTKKTEHNRVRKYKIFKNILVVV